MKLGDLSKKYEVGSRGAGTVSTGIGDYGGVSYGESQMSSKPNGGTVTKFIAQLPPNFKSKFSGLTAGSVQFTAAWKDLAKTEPEEFARLQHDFIKKTHYDVLVAKIKAENKIDINNYSFALQNVVWSVAVQHGGNTLMFDKAFKASGLTDSYEVDYDKKLIKAIYKERSKRDANGNLAYFSKNSKEVQRGVANRFINEEKDALKILEEIG